MAAKILVTGDVVLDHNIYAGQRLTPDSDSTVGMKYRKEPGGALLTHGLLNGLKKATADSASEIAFGLQETTADALHNWPTPFHGGATWAPVGGPKDAKWKLSQYLGYGDPSKAEYPGKVAKDIEKFKPSLLVIDDGAMGFRLKTSKCWPESLADERQQASTDWVLLKMSAPVARGDLWRVLADKGWKDRLIVLVSADNLRREDVRVTKGLSWESTVNDLVDEIATNPAISGLQSCRHLIITLRGDAALWFNGMDSSGNSPCHLVFDRERGEGEWEDAQPKESAFGFLSAVTAALAWKVKDAGRNDQLDLIPALKAGLSLSRFLREQGHGPVKAAEPGFPFDLAAKHLLEPTYKYASSEVRCSTGACPAGENRPNADEWTILGRAAHAETFPGPLHGPGRRLALLGPSALNNVPCARFGKLLTLDRREVESLRSLRQLMLSYHTGGVQKQPLSLAVFGAPGSGKSFGIKQIAEGVFAEKNAILEFNLSQFKGPEDLIGAYHQVRDKVLTGATPLVFWDEFDSGEYKWLQYLLAPMQDGVFQDGQLSHTIGKCVFVFAGGTSRDFVHFGPPERSRANETEVQTKLRRAFIMAKGPDFKSRLSGFLDVLGPNPGQVFNDDPAAAADPWVDDPGDMAFPVRRASLMRSLLGFVKDKESAPLQIDRGLLTALLETSHFRNGARSMEKLIGYMKDRGGVPLRRAHLPPDSLLALYVEDVPGFHALIRRSYAFLAQAERLAPALHQDWLDNLKPEEKTGSYYVPYEELDQEGKAANVAAALRIPETLALVGFVLEKGKATDDEEKRVSEFLDQYLELLAEAEHQGWEQQKRLEGWTYGPPPKSFEKRTQPLLIPYADLPEDEKEKDRRTIQNYPKYAEGAGFKIVSQRVVALSVCA